MPNAPTSLSDKALVQAIETQDTPRIEALLPSYRGSLEVLMATLRKGDGDLLGRLLEVWVPTAKQPQADLCALAVYEGDLGMVIQLEAALGPGASTLLAMAALRGHSAMVEWLVDRRDPAHNRSLALKNAAGRGFLPLVERLLPYSPPQDYAEVLVSAATGGHVAVVERLLPLTDPKAYRSKALRMASQRGHGVVVKRLLPVSDPRAKRSEALRESAMNGHVDVVALLAPVSDPLRVVAIGHQCLGHQKWGSLDALAMVAPLDVVRGWRRQAPEWTLEKAQARLDAHALQVQLAAGLDTADAAPRRRARM